LFGHESTIYYLQKLGPEQIELIFEYAGWVIKANPFEALKIFTEDMDEVKALPREDVYNYIERTDKQLVIPYIEHVITEWSDTTMQFHNLYAMQLMQHISHLNEVGDEKSNERYVTELRKKLNDFLLSSEHYSAERLLSSIPTDDDFFEERALLLGRLGKHEKAVAIYVHVLKDTSKALRYCRMTYDAQMTGYQDVYFHLLRMYLRPPPSGTSVSGVGRPPGDDVSSSTTNLSETFRAEALKLLRENPSRLNPVKVLNILPVDISLADIVQFLEAALICSSSSRWSGLVLKGLLYTKRLQVEEQRMYCYRNSFIITDDMTCPVCRKKIGNSAFSRIPPNEVVHLCCKDVYINQMSAADQTMWENLVHDTDSLHDMSLDYKT